MTSSESPEDPVAGGVFQRLIACGCEIIAPLEIEYLGSKTLGD
jgi:hypothetical protein